MSELPKKLNNSPLLEALFEIRFEPSSQSVSTIFPGLLFTQFVTDGKDGHIEHFPIAQLPQAMRDSDPNIKFAPLSRLVLDDFFINIGDRCLSIGCDSSDYKDWSNFRGKIEPVLKKIDDSKFVKSVSRYSIKYVNLIELDDITEQISFLNLDLKLGKGNYRVLDDSFNIRLEIKENEFISIVTLASSVEVSVKDTIKSGLIVDVDTISTKQKLSLKSVISSLDDIKKINKSRFFNSLREDISLLEPVYENLPAK